MYSLATFATASVLFASTVLSRPTYEYKEPTGYKPKFDCPVKIRNSCTGDYWDAPYYPKAGDYICPSQYSEDKFKIECSGHDESYIIKLDGQYDYYGLIVEAEKYYLKLEDASKYECASFAIFCEEAYETHEPDHKKDKDDKAYGYNHNDGKKDQHYEVDSYHGYGKGGYNKYEQYVAKKCYIIDLKTYYYMTECDGKFVLKPYDPSAYQKFDFVLY